MRLCVPRPFSSFCKSRRPPYLLTLSLHDALPISRAGPKLRDLARLDDLCIVPSGIDQMQFAVVFSRNREIALVRDEDGGDLFRRGKGGWSHNPPRAGPKLRDLARLDDLCIVPSVTDQVQFAVAFSRNREL